MWTIHPVYSRELAFRDHVIRANGPNTDGINPDSCQKVLVERCDIATGDDSIAIKSGRDRDGRRVGKPSKDIIIRNCRFARGHSGVAIGSETSGGVSNVRISDSTCDATNAGILIKTQRGRGAVIEDVLAERITLKNVKRDGLMISMRYNVTKPEERSERTPTVRDVTYRDVRGTCEQRAGRLIGLEEQEVTGVRMERVNLDARDGFALRWTNDVQMNDVGFRVQRGPAFEVADSGSVRVDGLSVSRSNGDARGPFIEIIDVRGVSIRNVTAPRETTGELARVTGPETRDVELDVVGTEPRVVRQGERDTPMITVTTRPSTTTSTTATSGPSASPSD
jgi:polygalacturonase